MLRMKWQSEMEIRIFAEHGGDVSDLREVMSPNGTKGILIQKCGMRLLSEEELPSESSKT